MASDGQRDQTGTIGSVPIRLAATPRPYRHFYTDTVQGRQDVAGTDARAESQRSNVREWKLDDWTGGFGNPTWRSDQSNVFNLSRNMAPEFRGVSYGGLTLGPSVSTTSDDSPATFAPSSPAALWFARDPAETELTVWGIKTRALHPWLPATAQFDATAITAGAVAGEPRQVLDPDDGFLYVLESGTNDVYQVDISAPTNTLHFDQSVASVGWGTSGTVTMITYRGEIYVLNNKSDLWRMSRSSTNTATKVVDAFYSEAILSTRSYTNRIGTSDVGVIWFHPSVSGVDIWEYNVAEDSSAIIHRIDEPVFPWGLMFVGGFVFLGYSTSAKSETPNVYVKYFRGGQEGILGPFIDQSEAWTVTFGGAYQGRFLIIKASELNSPDDPYEIFAYDLAAGASHHWATGVNGTSTHSAAAGPPRMLGKHLLVPSSSATNTYRVELVNFEGYSTSTAGDAYLDTGRYDFDLPGTLKLLTDVTVTLDPLPANTSVQIQYSLDGGAWQNNSMDITADNATTATFSMATQNDTFYELELRILLNSTVTTAGPVIRSITARAMPMSVQEGWDLDVDLNPTHLESATDLVHPDAIVAALVALKTDKVTVTFTNPWETDTLEGDSTLTDTVVVQLVDHPDIGAPEAQRYARVRLLKASLS